MQTQTHLRHSSGFAPFYSIPEHFWREAALNAVYTINKVLSPTTLKKSPYELLCGSPLDYQSLRVFGCVCFVLFQPHERTKLEPRSLLCCFLGYGIEHKGYRCYDPLLNAFASLVMSILGA
jgi:hypothetical protein